MTTSMSASAVAKSIGIKNLATVTAMTSISPQTLRNWCIHRPALFRLIVKGCVAETSDVPIHHNEATHPSDEKMADKVAAQQAAAKAALEARKPH